MNTRNSFASSLAYSAESNYVVAPRTSKVPAPAKRLTPEERKAKFKTVQAAAMRDYAPLFAALAK